MSETKVQFSAPELTLMCNAELILTKNKIIEKVKSLLEEVQQQMMEETAIKMDWIDDALLSIPPKVSKGENYGGLPYLILDYPRNFTHNNTFTIRSMFWWGRFLSSTLHVGGDYISVGKEKLLHAYPLLQNRNYYLCINKDPWQHHFEADNYIAISLLSVEDFETLLSAQAHIKIAAKWPLSEAHFTANTLFESWKFLLEIIYPPSR